MAAQPPNVALPSVALPGVALIVRSNPYRQRAARSQLDVALVAGALGRPLRLYFVGAAALQLLTDREPGAAGLPAGYRAWASLPELTEVRAFAEPSWISYFDRRGAAPLLRPEPMAAGDMRSDWRDCDLVLVL
jgi:hypothetical protein